MKLLLFILGVFAAIICIEKPAEAQDYPWCTYYNFDHGGARNCGFATFQQCLAAVSGVGGSAHPVHTTNSSRTTIGTDGATRIDQTTAPAIAPAASQYSPRSAAPRLWKAISPGDLRPGSGKLHLLAVRK